MSSPPTAGQRIRSRRTVERVIRRVAGKDVVKRVAGGVYGVRARQRQILDIVTKRVVKRRLNCIGACVCLFDHRVIGVNNVGVVTRATDQSVSSGATIQHIVTGVPGNDIVQRVAGAVDQGGPEQGEIFDIVSQCIGDPGLSRVSSLTRQFGDDVTHIVDNVNVVAQTAGQRVGVSPAVEQVIAEVAVERIAATIAVNLVMAFPANQDVGGTIPVQIVVESCAGDVLDRAEIVIQARCRVIRPRRLIRIGIAAIDRDMDRTGCVEIIQRIRAIAAIEATGAGMDEEGVVTGIAI